MSEPDELDEALQRLVERRDAQAPQTVERIFERHPRRFELPRKLRWRLLKARHRATDALFAHGAEMSVRGSVVQPEHEHPEFAQYQPSGWLWLRRALGRAGAGPDDVLADLGAGKGLVLLAAARRYPLKRAIGVEIAEALAEAAEKNVRREAERLLCPVEIVHADAADWVVPDDVSIIYLYYPFVGETFDRVMANVVASLDRAPRRLRIVYACPAAPEHIERTGRFELVRNRRVGLSGHVTRRVAVYESRAPADRRGR